MDAELKLIEEKKYSSSTINQMHNILNLIDTAIKGTQITSDYEYYIQKLNFAITTYTQEATRSGDLSLYPKIHDWKAREYLANEELLKLKNNN